MNSQPIHIGIDVGSVSLKLAAWLPSEWTMRFPLFKDNPGSFNVREASDPQFGDGLLVVSRYVRHFGEPLARTAECIAELKNLFNDREAVRVSATGSGGKETARAFGFEYVNEYRAIVEGVGWLYPDIRTVLEMGGGSSKFIRFNRESDGSVRIEDYETNGECAAGTGLFFDQQVERLEIRVEDVGSMVRGASRSAAIAGRCSVFAKSDMIHAQQRGFTPPEILKGLCESVVRNFKGSVLKGKEIIPKTVLIGGVSINACVVDAFRSLLDLYDGNLLVPDLGPWMGAVGAAFIGNRETRIAGKNVPSSEFRVSNDKSKNFQKIVTYSRNASENAELGIRNSKLVPAQHPCVAPLSMDKVVLLRDRITPFFMPKDRRTPAYLGIDIGSVSTNLALITEAGELIHGIYTMTRGRPIDVVGECLCEMESVAAEGITLRGVGTTGSGRDLIGLLVGADVIKDEITAHKTGALHVAKTCLDRDIDAIFEIGGQDSKFISLKQGVVVDFCLNEACAAGTGSFLEEQAKQIGVAIRDEFAELALRSKKPLKLGERCTVFMAKELIPYLQQGVPKEDLVAGLALSVAQNYLNRVVKKRPIGKTIFLQGGTAYNDAVAAAFATLLEREIIVPPHNGIMGAIGAALLARDRAVPGKATCFRGWRLNDVPRSMREFTCKACSNRCEIQEFTVAGEKSCWGDKCSDRYRKRAKTEKRPVMDDLIRFREEAIKPYHISETRRKGSRGEAGIPLALFFHDRLPFWTTYLQSLDFDLRFSGMTHPDIASAGVEASINEPCFPIQVANGHMAGLMHETCDFVFFPNVVNEEDPVESVASFLCPWVQTFPLVARHVRALEPIRNRIFCPRVMFREGPAAVEKRLLKEMAPWKVKAKENRIAVRKAYDAQNAFRAQMREKGEAALKILSRRGEPGIVLIGRSYNLHDPGINLNIPRKLVDWYGTNVIPMDFLPIDGIDVRSVNDHMFWNYGRRILQAARFVRDLPTLQLIFLSNFKCGPDSYIRHYVEEAAGRPFLFLQLDSHSNDAGVMTRIEAFLESKGML